MARSDWRRRHVNHDMPAAFPDDKTHVEVSVFYGEGGMSMFTYKHEPRGFWASAKAVKIEPPGPDGRFGCKSFMMFGDPLSFKVFLKAAPRFSAKVLAELDAKVAAVAEEVAARYAAGDKAGAAAPLLALREAAPAAA